jgi:hypothetical protein
MAKPSMSMKSKSMEMEPGEGKKHEMAETAQEEMREGAEPDDMPAGKTNRKRSAKGAKNTKAPMDGEGCSCGARKGKASCDGNCGSYGKKMDRNDALTPQEYLAACDLGIQGRSRSYIRARLDTAERLDLKCGKGSISQGEKCSKGAATKAEGPSAGVQIGQGLKTAGKVALETVKWTSGYNLGKTLASGITGGKNEKGSMGSKVASVTASTFLFGPQAGFGAARRVGAFGATDLQQHAQNEKKEKAWRRSVGYRDGGTYAKGFSVDYNQLAI